MSFQAHKTSVHLQNTVLRTPLVLLEHLTIHWQHIQEVFFSGRTLAKYKEKVTNVRAG